MKNLFTTFMFLVLAVSVWAADIIIKQDETRIDAIITEVSESTIKYRKVSNPNGPLFVIKVEEIASIIYSNGEVQAYNTAPADNSTSASVNYQVQLKNQSISAYDAYWQYKLEEEKNAKVEKARLDSIRLVEQTKRDSLRYAELARRDSIRIVEKARRDSIWTQQIEAWKQKNNDILFQAHVEISGMVSGKDSDPYSSFATGSNWGGFGVDGVFGFRSPKKYNFFGVGLGFHGQFSSISEDLLQGTAEYCPNCTTTVYTYSYDYYFFDNYRMDNNESDTNNKVQLWYMPLYVNDRIYIPTSVGVNPFVDLTLGGFVILGGKCGGHHYDRNYYHNYEDYGYAAANHAVQGGLFCRIGAGVEWKHFNFGVGYQLMFYPSFESRGILHSAYFKVGYRFGKTNKEDQHMY